MAPTLTNSLLKAALLAFLVVSSLMYIAIFSKDGVLGGASSVTDKGAPTATLPVLDLAKTKSERMQQNVDSMYASLMTLKKENEQLRQEIAKRLADNPEAANKATSSIPSSSSSSPPPSSPPPSTTPATPTIPQSPTPPPDRRYLPQSEVDFALSFLPASEHLSELALLKQIHTSYPPSSGHVVFSVFGDNPKYTAGLTQNIRLLPIYYPGWSLRVYVASDVPPSIVASYSASPNVEVIEMGRPSSGLNGALWRFLAAVDPSVSRYVVRDADSRLNGREREAVQEWIASGKSMHVMRDHPNHDYAVNAGMWGGVKGMLSWESIVAGIGDVEKGGKSTYGDDQRFLRDVVYKELSGNIIGHDSFSCSKWENSKPFPAKRSENMQHVGQVFDDKNNPRMGDITCCMYGKQSPMQCRAKPEWTHG